MFVIGFWGVGGSRFENYWRRRRLFIYTVCFAMLSSADQCRLLLLKLVSQLCVLLMLYEIGDFRCDLRRFSGPTNLGYYYLNECESVVCGCCRDGTMDFCVQI